MHMAETSASACFRAPLGQTAVAKRVAYLAEGRLRQMLLPTKHALTSDRHVVHRWSWPRAPTGSTDRPRGNLWGSWRSPNLETRQRLWWFQRLLSPALSR